jgi:hypothetical protein
LTIYSLQGLVSRRRVTKRHLPLARGARRDRGLRGGAAALQLLGAASAGSRRPRKRRAPGTSPAWLFGRSPRTMHHCCAQSALLVHESCAQAERLCERWANSAPAAGPRARRGPFFSGPESGAFLTVLIRLRIYPEALGAGGRADGGMPAAPQFLGGAPRRSERRCAVLHGSVRTERERGALHAPEVILFNLITNKTTACNYRKASDFQIGARCFICRRCLPRIVRGMQVATLNTLTPARSCAAFSRGCPGWGTRSTCPSCGAIEHLRCELFENLGV